MLSHCNSADGPWNGSGGTPRLGDRKERAHVSSVVATVTLGKARIRFRAVVSVYGALHPLRCRSATYMTV